MKHINAPPHYTSDPSGVECLDIAEWLGHNLGHAFAAVWRAGKKSPDPTEDMSKALFYVRREILRRERAAAVDTYPVDTTTHIPPRIRALMLRVDPTNKSLLSDIVRAAYGSAMLEHLDARIMHEALAVCVPRNTMAMVRAH